MNIFKIVYIVATLYKNLQLLNCFDLQHHINCDKIYTNATNIIQMRIFYLIYLRILLCLCGGIGRRVAFRMLCFIT